MAKINIDVLINERKALEKLYYEVKHACVMANVLPSDENESFTKFILDKYYYDVEKWVNEFYRVAGYMFMIDNVRTDAVYACVCRAIRLNYIVADFLSDLVSDWESYRTTFGPYSIILDENGNF